MVDNWKVIAKFPEYAVSDHGRIKRIVPDYRGNCGKILRPRIGKRYAAVTLYANKMPYLVLIHRAVCEAFHGLPPSPKHHAAHKDGDGTNNRSGNLRWATPTENEADKIFHGRSLHGRPSAVRPERRPRGKTHGRSTMPERTARGERTGTSKLTASKVIAIRNDARSRKEIAEDYGITVTMVGYIVRGISWTHIPMQTEKRV